MLLGTRSVCVSASGDSYLSTCCAVSLWNLSGHGLHQKLYRTYEDSHGCSKAITFAVKSVEKGEKIIKSTEVLLRLELNESLTAIVNDYDELSKGQDGARAKLEDVTSEKFRASFRCYFWGDVSNWAMAMAVHCQLTVDTARTNNEITIAQAFIS